MCLTSSNIKSTKCIAKYRQTPVLISVVLLTLLITWAEGQIVYSDENYSNVRINMCCDLNLQFGGGSCSSNGGSGGNTQAFKSNQDSQDGVKSRSERQVQRPAEWSVPAQHMANNEMTVFTLANKQPSCTNGLNIQRLNISQEDVQFLVYPDGTLAIGPNRYQLDLYNINQYCVNGKTSNYVDVKTCIPVCSADEPCLYKCCAMGKVFSPSNPDDRNCDEVQGTEWSPLYFRKPKDPDTLLSPEESGKKRPFYFIRHPSAFQHTCTKSNNKVISLVTSKGILGFGYARLRLSEDGKVWHRNQDRKWVPIEKTMCLDGIQNFGEEPLPYNNSLDEMVIFTCPLDDPEIWTFHEYYGYLPVVCSLFALLTVIVYGILWEKQNVHGYTIMAYSATVFFLFIFLGVSHLTTAYNSDLAGTIECKILGTITHFLFISMFSWLTVISLDLWLTFRTMTIVNTKSKGVKRFLMYCVFGLGIPAFMVILAWTLEAVYLYDENSEIKVPQYGIHVCYVYTEVLWEYSYGTVAILFGVNLLLFLQTTWKLVEYKRSTRFATKTAQNRQSYFLYVKLFFMVGILWIFEIISWAVSGPHITIPWLFFDSLNCFQPIWIFFIFVFKYDTITSLGDKIPCLKPYLRHALVLLDLCECKKRVRQISTKASTGDTGDETTGLNMTKTTDDRNEFSKSDH